MIIFSLHKDLILIKLLLFAEVMTPDMKKTSSKDNIRMTKNARLRLVNPHYLDMVSLEANQDLKLVSISGGILRMHKCVFATMSNVCHQMLTSAYSMDEPEITIVTDHSKSMLYKLICFAKTGKVFGYHKYEDLIKDDDTVNAFLDFGVNLADLKLTPFALKWDDLEYKDIQQCLRNVIWHDPSLLKQEPQLKVEECNSDTVIKCDETFEEPDPSLTLSRGPMEKTCDSVFSCTMCEKMYTSKAHLKRHVRQIHDHDYKAYEQGSHLKGMPVKLEDEGCLSDPAMEFDNEDQTVIKVEGQASSEIGDDFIPSENEMLSRLQSKKKTIKKRKIALKNDPDFEPPSKKRGPKGPRSKKEKTVACHYCGQKVLTEILLQRHLLNKHRDEMGTLKCPHCPMTFPETAKLGGKMWQKHMARFAH